MKLGKAGVAYTKIGVVAGATGSVNYVLHDSLVNVWLGIGIGKLRGDEGGDISRYAISCLLGFISSKELFPLCFYMFRFQSPSTFNIKNPLWVRTQVLSTITMTCNDE